MTPAATSTGNGFRVDYGQDAPVVVRNLLVWGGVGLILGFTMLLPPSFRSHSALQSLARSSLSTGFACIATGLVMIWGSRVGKLKLRDRVLSQFIWRGDQHVLDVGCGHGLMLIGAAKRLSTGRAVGLDLWQQEDQAKNSATATLENARRAGVESRVELVDGDARAMPFGAEVFDIILSSWALHNIYNLEERRRALQEIARVLKPGGQIAPIDIRHTLEYTRALKNLGLIEIKRRGPNFLFVTPSYVVFARKP